MAPTNLHIGICGAGIGGVMAAICIAEAGAQVTVLEAASELGEIGAGIQMTPNVARLLRKYGVDKAIGENLTRFEELNMRRKDGTKVGYTRIARIEQALGQPWWLVHRHHLHTGLVEVARRRGVVIKVASRVAEIEYQQNERVNVRTESGEQHSFDLLIGADGVGSIVRRTLFPSVKPAPPTGNCAYRAIVPYAQIKEHPELHDLVDKLAMEVWMAPGSYIISYPISAGKDFNMVLSHHRDPMVSTVQEIDMEDMRREYRDYDPRISKIVDMIPEAQRWPLLVTGPLESWSSPQKNVVLMGDAAHSMVNHMAQGAATSMEDGAFLGICLRQVIQGSLTIPEAIGVYEKGRMPKAHMKQQVSFLNGAIWQVPDGPAQEARDAAMAPELRGEPMLRSPSLYSDPATVLEVYGYDAEAHANEEIAGFLNRGRRPRDAQTGITAELADKYANWFLPKDQHYLIKSKI